MGWNVKLELRFLFKWEYRRQTLTHAEIIRTFPQKENLSGHRNSGVQIGTVGMSVLVFSWSWEESLPNYLPVIVTIAKVGGNERVLELWIFSGVEAIHPTEALTRRAPTQQLHITCRENIEILQQTITIPQNIQQLFLSYSFRLYARN